MSTILVPRTGPDRVERLDAPNDGLVLPRRDETGTIRRDHLLEPKGLELLDNRPDKISSIHPRGDASAAVNVPLHQRMKHEGALGRCQLEATCEDVLEAPDAHVRSTLSSIARTFSDVRCHSAV